MATPKKIVPAPLKVAVKKAPATKPVIKIKPIAETFTKSGLLAHLASETGVVPKDVKAVMTALEDTISASINKKGLGQFTLPGLLKITALKVEKKAKRKGKDPFTGEERWFAAKPASVRVKIRPLKKLKDAAI